jgi:4-hydroxy-tetrahydrodipicolinate reductase
LIADAIGWRIDRIEETRKPIISMIERKTASVVVEPGRVAGCLHTAIAYRDGLPVIRLIHPQQICPHLEGVKTGDSIEIVGTPNIHLCGKPEFPGGEGTISIAVNMIPRVLCARPGLHTMLDLPVPAAMLGDARDFVRARN